MKKLLILSILLLLSVSIAYGASFYPFSGALTGGGAGALDKVTGTENKDTAIVILEADGTYGNSFFAYVLDVDAAGVEAVPTIIDAGDAGDEDWELCKGVFNGVITYDDIELGHISDTTIARSGAGAVTIEGKQIVLTGVAAGREFSSQAYTASGNISEAQILANKYLTNQGEDAAENDLVLPDLEYYVNVIFIVNEAYIIEINPPNADAHEAFDLDGTRLDLSDCIDSPIVVGSKISATRMQDDDGTWHWSFDTIRGAWVDTAGTD